MLVHINTMKHRNMNMMKHRMNPCCFYPYSKARLRLFRFVWKCVISSVPLRNKRLYRPVTMKLPYASEKKRILVIFTGKHIKYLCLVVQDIFNYIRTKSKRLTMAYFASNLDTQPKKKYKICHFSHVLGSYGEPPEKSLCF